jgi:hypothetical protein
MPRPPGRRGKGRAIFPATPRPRPPRCRPVRGTVGSGLGDDETPDEVGAGSRHGDRDPAAERLTKEQGGWAADRFEREGDILGERRRGDHRGSLLAATVTAQVQREDVPILAQPRSRPGPLLGMAGETVHEHGRRTLAAEVSERERGPDSVQGPPGSHASEDRRRRPWCCSCPSSISRGRSQSTVVSERCSLT